MNNNFYQSDAKVNLEKSDIPFSIFSSPHIEMFGNNKIQFEGKYSIMEYTTNFLKIKLSKYTLDIIGSELALNNVETGGFLLTGNVAEIKFV